MKRIVLGLYRTFQCIAQECPATCCAGWRIKVAAVDYERFLRLEPQWLRKDIQKNIYQTPEGYFFKNDARHRCAMLDEDGLCRIQRNTAESVLCNTCRKYPRLINRMEETLYLSMAASCPVVADYLVSSHADWCLAEDTLRQERKICPGRTELGADAWRYYEENRSAAEQYALQRKNTDFLYPCFEKMADEVLDVLLNHTEGRELLLFLEGMEDTLSGLIEIFAEETSLDWKRISENYMHYRILTRQMEFPEEAPERTLRQSAGEAFFVRMAAFLRYSRHHRLEMQDWSEIICKVYRFCAHGKKISKELQDIWDSFFSQDFIWLYVLQ